MNKQLKDMLDEFLSEKRVSQGGFSKPTVNDMSQLQELIYELLLLKFELDPDGDLPVSYILVDKTVDEMPHYLPTMRTDKLKTQKDLIRTLLDLNINSRMADDRFQTAFRIFTDITSRE